jgi:hypothetical protein
MIKVNLFISYQTTHREREKPLGESKEDELVNKYDELHWNARDDGTFWYSSDFLSLKCALVISPER